MPQFKDADMKREMERSKRSKEKCSSCSKEAEYIINNRGRLNVLKHIQERFIPGRKENDCQPCSILKKVENCLTQGG